jgi:arginyl-tRNA synthetase
LRPALERKAVAVEPPRDASHGDLATNAAMVLAKGAGTNPRALAALIVPKLEALEEVEKAEAAGPGFINIRLSPAIWQEELRTILADGAITAARQQGAGGAVNVEYVSANPTGRCTWAIAAARWSATRWRACSNMPAMPSPANIMSTTRRPGRRSPAPRTCATASARAADRRHPEGLYPGRLSEAGRASARREFGDRYADAPRASGWSVFRRARSQRCSISSGGSRQLGVHHDLFAPSARCRNPAPSTAPSRCSARRAGL